MAFFGGYMGCCNNGGGGASGDPIKIKGHYVGYAEAQADGVVAGDFWIALPNHNGFKTGALIEQPAGI